MGTRPSNRSAGTLAVGRGDKSSPLRERIPRRYASANT